MEVFWKTIAQYNEATWIFQVIITIAGILLTVLLYQKPTLLIKRLMKGYMGANFRDDRDYLFPIPQGERDKSNNILSQNPGF